MVRSARLTKVERVTYVLCTSISTYLRTSYSRTRYSLHRQFARDMKIVKRRVGSNWNSNDGDLESFLSRGSQLVKVLGNVVIVFALRRFGLASHERYLSFFSPPCYSPRTKWECTYRSIDHFSAGARCARAQIFFAATSFFRARNESEDDGFRRISRHRLESSAYSIRLASVT